MKKNKKDKKKAKIFLLETCVEEQNKTQGKSIETNTVHYSMGFLYLDAVLRENNYEVLTKEYFLWKEENCLKEIEKNIREFNPDFVGIAMMSMTRISAYKAIKLIKSINPKIKLILGGIHPSLMPEQLLKNFPVEAICIGDSEQSLLEILRTLIKKKSLNNIKGIVYKNKKNKIIFTKIRPPNRELDKITFPNYDVFMNPEIKEVNMISSRGCPNNCSFCCIQVACKRIWRPISPKRVVDQIEYIIKKYPWVETISFVDDTLTLDNNRVIDICKEIINRNIKMNFNCEARIKPVSREMFYWMEKAGFTKVCFGIESGSEKILESIHKNITKEDCFKTFEILKEFKKIEVVKYLMVGLPGEDEKTVEETIEFVKKLQKIKKMNFFYATPFWLYPGTEVYMHAVSKGFIDNNYWLTDKPCPLYTLEHSEEWLRRMSNKIAFETMMAQGIIYFLGRVIKKLFDNPKYYLKRFLMIRGVK